MRQMSGRTSAPVPTAVIGPLPLAMVAALILLTLAAAFGHVFRSETHDAAAAPVVRERLLRFEDRADGAVVVTDGSNGRLVRVLVGENGFLRGTLSGLARIRRSNGIGRQIPFRVTIYADGRSVLDDPATGNTIELEAFGGTNKAAFTSLMTEQAEGP